MDHPISIAIETSCRAGGVALAAGERLVTSQRFDASARAATQVVARLEAMLRATSLRPQDLEEVYVSAGPGSFTGLRVGVTVARTLAQTVEALRCVAVPTPLAIAEGARSQPWEHLAVILDSRQGQVHASLLARCGDRVEPVGDAGVVSAEDLLARAPRPITLIGEGLAFHEIAGDGVTIAPGDPLADHLPTVENVWRVGRRLARQGEFTEYHHLLPIYARKPEAVRLWQLRHGEK